MTPKEIAEKVYERHLFQVVIDDWALTILDSLQNDFAKKHAELFNKFMAMDLAKNIYFWADKDYNIIIEYTDYDNNKIVFVLTPPEDIEELTFAALSKCKMMHIESDIEDNETNDYIGQNLYDYLIYYYPNWKEVK